MLAVHPALAFFVFSALAEFGPGRMRAQQVHLQQLRPGDNRQVPSQGELEGFASLGLGAGNEWASSSQWGFKEGQSVRQDPRFFALLKGSPPDTLWTRRDCAFQQVIIESYLKSTLLWSIVPFERVWFF